MTKSVSMTRFVSMGPSGPAELAVLSVAAVCRPPATAAARCTSPARCASGEWPPPLERGATAVTGASVRAGTAGAGICGAAAWLRCGTRSGLPGPACWAPTVGFPAADGAPAVCRDPATREYSPKPSATTSASASARPGPAGAPETERPRGCSRTADEPAERGSAERAAATSPAPQAGPADADSEPGPTWPATPPGLPLTTPPATGRPRRTPRPAARGRPRRP